MSFLEKIKEKRKRVISLFSSYDDMKSQIGEMSMYDDILAMQFSSNLNEFVGRVQNGEIANTVERIAMQREKREELIYIILILERSIYVASSNARVKDRKRITGALKENLFNGVTREFLEIKLEPRTLAKYRETAIQFAMVALDNYGII